ncbi:hypothetical protein LOC67_14730 [Stieleria sp. JC731]|uniref:hypothetical protein n=1 Tax=Pirellulaceae TaxID=2691357 RepID=UPI001E387E55|nr:hypothetical protein [Stieleria sp. JC731]MCC9601813.1 hypothetical protein [Stieleria sp. JC731]
MSSLLVPALLHPTPRSTKPEASLRSKVLGIVLACAPVGFVAAAEPPTSSAQVAETKSGAHQTPIVLRVSEDIFNSNSELETQSDVDCCILGVRNLGTADVNAKTLIRFVPSDENARLKIHFTGHFIANTHGQKGPARIHSRSKMKFDLAMEATFDEESGFSSGEPNGSVVPVDSNRRITSTLPGIRGRIVHSVAKRRMAETEHQVEQICIANAKSELIKEMERRVQKELATANERWAQMKTSLEKQPWNEERPTFQFTSDDGYLVIHVNEPGPDQNAESRGLQMIAELPDPAPDAMTEILLSRDWVERNEQKGALLSFAASYPRLLNFTLKAATDFSLPCKEEDDWLVYTLHKKEQPEAVSTARKIASN